IAVKHTGSVDPDRPGVYALELDQIRPASLGQKQRHPEPYGAVRSVLFVKLFEPHGVFVLFEDPAGSERHWHRCEVTPNEHAARLHWRPDLRVQRGEV